MSDHNEREIIAYTSVLTLDVIACLKITGPVIYMQFVNDRMVSTY